LCLFWEHPWGHPAALAIFIIASITDAYDGYYARKYDQVTPEGKFLDPLADKILVSSAFISFALMGIIEFWMVGLIIFRDLFVTGLRMAMERKGLSLVTSTIAKTKTAIQMGIISFILVVLGLKGLSLAWAMPMLDIIREYRLVYNLTLSVTLFTLITGITYLYSNRNVIQNFLEKE
jgi:CDP-diacylglycerol--glycerol-3-phosphate 3-phosphatidyltransferase